MNNLLQFLIEAVYCEYAYETVKQYNSKCAQHIKQ